MKNVTVINNLGLRASYGLQGNIDKNTSPYLIGIYDQTTILPGNSEDASVRAVPQSRSALGKDPIRKHRNGFVALGQHHLFECGLLLS